ncbi:putative aryl-alcohol dehydrogenase [Wickerhamomyces ciferrii]|uniref:Aryl-alcohol dehydrogenase n=1 Tax=Wickerhamomyces ciferrii (strain ATCC 14091 / BCRC 22168 / CBS 111 / JCM 3599 / NBRC 0793 / NRRL Y-1031 F-60-10) TaxID=1206466 RepID=K0KTB4_WICCF|nr:putative aryl-alcohol dehydrogenase [Wickerhamomyces ciferrii]CCH44614.1 putative aryl-alcohol dehydrogenase [Wickerhamomyces ciferrii]
MSEVQQFVPWKNLGKSGLKISNVIVGCMSFGSKSWLPWVEDDEEKIFKILNTAYDHGIRTFDTADVYSNGLSEVLLGKFLKKYNIKRDKVVILTKVYFPVDEDLVDFSVFNKRTPEQELDLQNSQGLTRKHIFDAIEGSIKRLGTYVDVYQIHRFDPNTPVEETLKALNDVVEAGYTRYIGASLMKAVQFAELQFIAEKNGWHKFISMQSYYNLLNREDEQELNYFADKTGVGLIPYSPLAAGALAKPIPNQDELTERQKAPYGQRTTNTAANIISQTDPSQESERSIINRVGELAEKKNSTRAAVAIAWSISKGAAPILGLSSEKRVLEAVEGANLQLTNDEIKYLEEPYIPRVRRA